MHIHDCKQISHTCPKSCVYGMTTPKKQQIAR